MQLTEIMTSNPTSIDSDATVAQALDMLYSLDVRHLPVVEGDQLVGMLSDRDLRGLALASTGGDEAELAAGRYLERPVTDVMNASVVTADSEEDLDEVITLMIEHRVGALPVVNSVGNLVGIVSYVDILRQLRELL